MKKHSFLVGYLSLMLVSGLTAAPNTLLAETSAVTVSTNIASVRTQEAPLKQAQSLDQVASVLTGADVVVLGEVHDNPHHHRNQAKLIRLLKPTAVVWEMITQEQANLLSAEVLQDADKTVEVLDWNNSGWPEFSLYAPVFRAAAQAEQFGALVPREVAQTALEMGVAEYFGAAAARFGLDQPLSVEEQAEREADQLANHCNAMPAQMLPVLVDFQRLRDSRLAWATEQALQQSGGPVVVITGNGHARKDRGLSVYLTRALPQVRVQVLGQMEGEQIQGVFDVTHSSPEVSRPDPCLAFRQSD